MLDFTDHLSDRQLYCLIYRDILPSPEKKLDRSDNYLHWDCADAGGDPKSGCAITPAKRIASGWRETGSGPLPPSSPPPYPRQLPRRPL